jgi:hypothetical protein
MAANKIHFVESWHNGRKTVWSGTIADLSTHVFGYTLECGNSWNPKIPRYPKTIKSLVNALNKSAEECRRYSDCYDIAQPGTFDPEQVMKAV